MYNNNIKSNNRLDNDIMESVIVKLIESSVSAALLGVVLYVFLPRLLKSIDKLNENIVHSMERAQIRNAQEHETLTLMIGYFDNRLLWHEAKVYGVNGAIDSSTDEKMTKAIETFERAQREMLKLQEDIKNINKAQD